MLHMFAEFSCLFSMAAKGLPKGCQWLPAAPCDMKPAAEDLRAQGQEPLAPLPRSPGCAFLMTPTQYLARAVSLRTSGNQILAEHCDNLKVRETSCSTEVTVLCAPFWARSAHVVLFGPITSLARPRPTAENCGSQYSDQTPPRAPMRHIGHSVL